MNAIPTALSVAMLVDTSGSTAKDLKYETRVGDPRFLKALFSRATRDDAVALYSFNYQVTMDNNFTRQPWHAGHPLETLNAEAGTVPLRRHLPRRRDLEDREGRHVIVVVTDGGDTTSQGLSRRPRSRATGRRGHLSVLVVPIANDAGRNIGGENALYHAGSLDRRPCLRTPTSAPHSTRAFAEIIQDLRTQYLLGLLPEKVPTTKDRFHHLGGAGVPSGFAGPARNGYYGESESDSVPADDGCGSSRGTLRTSQGAARRASESKSRKQTTETQVRRARARTDV